MVTYVTFLPFTMAILRKILRNKLDPSLKIRNGMNVFLLIMGNKHLIVKNGARFDFTILITHKKLLSKVQS